MASKAARRRRKKKNAKMKQNGRPKRSSFKGLEGNALVAESLKWVLLTVLADMSRWEKEIREELAQNRAEAEAAEQARLEAEKAKAEQDSKELQVLESVELFEGAIASAKECLVRSLNLVDFDGAERHLDEARRLRKQANSVIPGSVKRTEIKFVLRLMALVKNEIQRRAEEVRIRRERQRLLKLKAEEAEQVIRVLLKQGEVIQAQFQLNAYAARYSGLPNLAELQELIAKAFAKAVNALVWEKQDLAGAQRMVNAMKKVNFKLRNLEDLWQMLRRKRHEAMLRRLGKQAEEADEQARSASDRHQRAEAMEPEGSHASPTRHFRRRHYRRAPGTPPDAPKTVPVRGHWVGEQTPAPAAGESAKKVG